MIEGPSSPEPVCEEHNRRVTTCVPCCVRIFEEAGELDEFSRHSWAVANVYLPKEKWAE
jgi:hypothetical protein